MGLSKAADGFYTATPTAGWQDGFNTGAPSASATMIIFVSSVTGKDSGDGGFNSAIQGSFAQPYRTIAAALARVSHDGNGVRSGSPDQVLLATGESWTVTAAIADFFGPGLDEQNRLVLSSYDKTATVSQASNIPPVPNPTTGTVARPIINGGGIYHLLSNTGVIGIDFYAGSRDTVANPANASNPDPGSGIFIQNNSANILLEDNRIRYFSTGMTIDADQSPQGSTGPISARRNVLHNCWGGFFGIGSDSVTPGFLLEENLVDTCGWDPIGQPDGGGLNHNWYLSGTNGISSIATGAVTVTQLSDLYMHGNISLSDLFQSNNRNGGHYNNNLWQLGGQGSNNYGPNNPAIDNIIENEVYIGGFLGGTGHTNFASSGVELTAAFTDGNPTDGQGHYGNGVSGIHPVDINNCIATQGIVNGSAVGLVQIGATSPDGAWANLVTVRNCISYKFSGTTVVSHTEAYTDGGGNLGTNSPTTAASFGWTHPERTPETYMAEVIGDGSTWADFSRRCRLQSRRNWNRMLMAESVNDYIRQGFGKAMIGSAYADTQGGPILMAQICM